MEEEIKKYIFWKNVEINFSSPPTTWQWEVQPLLGRRSAEWVWGICGQCLFGLLAFSFPFFCLEFFVFIMHQRTKCQKSPHSSPHTLHHISKTRLRLKIWIWVHLVLWHYALTTKILWYKWKRSAEINSIQIKRCLEVERKYNKFEPHNSKLNTFASKYITKYIYIVYTGRIKANVAKTSPVIVGSRAVVFHPALVKGVAAYQTPQTLAIGCAEVCKYIEWQASGTCYHCFHTECNDWTNCLWSWAFQRR